MTGSITQLRSSAISCFVFLCMGQTFQQAIVTPGTLERLWSAECRFCRWLCKSQDDQEEPLHHLKNVVAPFNLQWTGRVFLSWKTAITLLRSKNSRNIVQSVQSCFQVQGGERIGVRFAQSWMHVLLAPSTGAFVKSCPDVHRGVPPHCCVCVLVIPDISTGHSGFKATQGHQDSSHNNPWCKKGCIKEGEVVVGGASPTPGEGFGRRGFEKTILLYLWNFVIHDLWCCNSIS